MILRRCFTKKKEQEIFKVKLDRETKNKLNGDELRDYPPVPNPIHNCNAILVISHRQNQKHSDIIQCDFDP